jgi:hypothetical protein
MKTCTRMICCRGALLVFIGWLSAAAVCAETAETTTTGETAGTESVEAAPPPEAEAQQQQETTEQTSQPALVGPKGATGVIRRSDRRQDRRAGDPRID